MINHTLLQKIKKNNKLPIFHFKQFDAKDYLLTNETGEFVFLGVKDFANYLSGKITKKHKRYAELSGKGFIKTADYIENIAEKYHSKYAYLHRATGLHIMVLTLKCNHKCLYCHAAVGLASDRSLDMSKKTAKQTIDLIFSSPSLGVTIEFQGGEPLANWETLKFSVEYIQQKKKKSDKQVQITLVSNFSLLTSQKLDFLLKNNIALSTSLDGPEAVHNANRVWTGGNSYQQTVKWIQTITARLKAREKAQSTKKNFVPISLPGALVTITRRVLSRPRELVDTYVNLGLSSIFLRSLSPFGFAKKTWAELGYSAEEYSAFYRQALDYILELNRKGINFKESWTAIKLQRILNPVDPAFSDDRSPCGGGIGQIAYNYDGRVYTCDEGRMVSRAGEDIFQMGDVMSDSWEDLINSNAAKSICSVSCTEGVAGLSDHVYKPYIGVCPAYNYSATGNLQPNFYEDNYFKRHEAILDYIFAKMKEPEYESILRSWVNQVPCSPGPAHCNI